MRKQRGVNLIELMIAVSVLGILLALAMPNFSRMVQDAQNRTAAESVLNGLQLARTEALRRNTPVRFSLTDKEGKVAWTVGCVNPNICSASIQERTPEEGGGNARLGVSKVALPKPLKADTFASALAAGAGLDEPGVVTFDSFGRVSAAAGTEVNRVDVTNAKTTDARRYVVTVGAGGQVRMCDPNSKLNGTPQGCT
ncbi:type IV fimbrial biogenesis protein FimT [Duganella sp. CF458]|uniref:GspH/FimT family pseudopilin n=1 Tax=Duganella sp. CF458 TaxID=1884368 RepID=UPI0008E036A6|nr:GspH/FimT family pseudopilin [Duganella sp. CF458]SFG29055.1 type IV fimbrial biogenesis protein FimT [Duganella sp. CF458]